MSRVPLVLNTDVGCTVSGNRPRFHHGQKLASDQNEHPDAPSFLLPRYRFLHASKGQIFRIGINSDGEVVINLALY